jgi:hypothetical protein
MKTLLIFASFLAPISASAEAKLTLFRWNPGYRAENIPVLSQTLTAAEIDSVKKGTLPESKEIFRGCYLAHLEFTQDRNPASVKPVSEIHRVCTTTAKETN